MTAADLRLGIVGARAVGRCVAATFAAAGASVRVFDPDPDALAVLELGVALELDRVGLDPVAARRVSPVTSIETVADGVDIAFEAAPEDPGAKRAALVALTLAAPADAVIAMTGDPAPSGELSPAPRGEPSHAGGRDPEGLTAELPGEGRILGTLWWGTARPGGLVELIAAEATDPAKMDRAFELLEAAGRRVVRREFPGAPGQPREIPRTDRLHRPPRTRLAPRG